LGTGEGAGEADIAVIAASRRVGCPDVPAASIASTVYVNIESCTETYRSTKPLLYVNYCDMCVKLAQLGYVSVM
jgi:hypothetical protein